MKSMKFKICLLSVFLLVIQSAYSANDTVKAKENKEVKEVKEVKDVPPVAAVEDNKNVDADDPLNYKDKGKIKKSIKRENLKKELDDLLIVQNKFEKFILPDAILDMSPIALNESFTTNKSNVRTSSYLKIVAKASDVSFNWDKIEGFDVVTPLNYNILLAAVFDPTKYPVPFQNFNQCLEASYTALPTKGTRLTITNIKSPFYRFFQKPLEIYNSRVNNLLRTKRAIVKKALVAEYKNSVCNQHCQTKILIEMDRVRVSDQEKLDILYGLKEKLFIRNNITLSLLQNVSCAN